MCRRVYRALPAGAASMSRSRPMPLVFEHRSGSAGSLIVTVIGRRTGQAGIAAGQGVRPEVTGRTG